MRTPLLTKAKAISMSSVPNCVPLAQESRRFKRPAIHSKVILTTRVRRDVCTVATPLRTTERCIDVPCRVSGRDAFV